MFGVLLGLFLEQVEEGEALYLHLLAEHEGNAVVPGQRQLGRQLAGREVGLDLGMHFVTEWMADITDGRLFLADRFQLAVAVDGEAVRRLAAGQPVGHRRLR